METQLRDRIESGYSGDCVGEGELFQLLPIVRMGNPFAFQEYILQFFCQ